MSYYSPYLYAGNTPTTYIDQHGKFPLPYLVSYILRKSGALDDESVASVLNATGIKNKGARNTIQFMVGAYKGVDNLTNPVGYIGDPVLDAANSINTVYIYGSIVLDKKKAREEIARWRDAYSSAKKIYKDPSLLWKDITYNEAGELTIIAGSTLAALAYGGIGPDDAILGKKNSGGLIRYAKRLINTLRINTSTVKVSASKISAIKAHLSRMDPDAANDVMINRLEQIADGKLKPTKQDLNFFTHELREKHLMDNGMGYDAAHKQALDEFGIKHERGFEKQLYTPGALKAGEDAFRNEVK